MYDTVLIWIFYKAQYWLNNDIKIFFYIYSYAAKVQCWHNPSPTKIPKIMTIDHIIRLCNKKTNTGKLLIMQRIMERKQPKYYYTTHRKARNETSWKKTEIYKIIIITNPIWYPRLHFYPMVILKHFTTY